MISVSLYKFQSITTLKIKHFLTKIDKNIVILYKLPYKLFYCLNFFMNQTEWLICFINFLQLIGQLGHLRYFLYWIRISWTIDRWRHKFSYRWILIKHGNFLFALRIRKKSSFIIPAFDILLKCHFFIFHEFFNKNKIILSFEF